MSESFWQKDRMVTHILFDLCLFKHFIPVANFGQQSLWMYLFQIWPILFMISASRGRGQIYQRQRLKLFASDFCYGLLRSSECSANWKQNPPALYYYYCIALHIGEICQFFVWWIEYISESTERKTGNSHLWVECWCCELWLVRSVPCLA